MMIDFKMLEVAVEKVEKSFQALLKTYEKLPETICGCDNIGICCVSLPEMTVLEALSWIGAITELPPDERTVLLCKFVYFYLSNPIRRPGCPFRREGSCTMILGQKKAFLGKYAVIKEMVAKGSETRLDKLLKATSSDVWCLNFPNWPAG